MFNSGCFMFNKWLTMFDSGSMIANTRIMMLSKGSYKPIRSRIQSRDQLQVEYIKHWKT